MIFITEIISWDQNTEMNLKNYPHFYISLIRSFSHWSIEKLLMQETLYMIYSISTASRQQQKDTADC
jgi:hypothetical protein